MSQGTHCGGAAGCWYGTLYDGLLMLFRRFEPRKLSLGLAPPRGARGSWVTVSTDSTVSSNLQEAASESRPLA